MIFTDYIEAAIYDRTATGITALNRLSNMLGIIIDVDPKDTAATKKFLGDSVMEIYREAIADIDMEWEHHDSSGSVFPQ